MKIKVAITTILLASTLMALPSAAETKMMVLSAAARYDVPPSLALRIANVETKNKCGVIGRKNERGPMQILPATARGFGYRNIQGASCETQVEAAMVYLKHCLDSAHGNETKAVACYNAGPKALGWRVLPARVAAYVRKVFE